MDQGPGDRGVSEVIGFILIFAFLVGAFTIYQGLVVPAQNRQVEFQHNQEVQGDMQDLRNAIVSTAAIGTSQSVSIEMGATYPNRAIAQNLGLSAGAIRTESVGRIRVANARALDAETADYLDGSTTHEFETTAIRYSPVYSFYATAPDTVYENSIVFNEFDDENITLTDQIMVDGRRITLIALNGSLDVARRGTISVSPEAISASSNRVSVTNVSGEHVNVTIPTRRSAAAWEEILEGEMTVAPDGYVLDVVPVAGEDAVTLVMRGGVTYDVRLAKVGVGSGSAAEGPQYVTDVSGNGSTVPEGGSQSLVVEVRDRFNNPVSNVTVALDSAPGSGTVSPAEETTDGDGLATFTYEAPADVNSLTEVRVEFAFDDGSSVRENVTFVLQVLDSDGSGGGAGQINPADSGDVRLEEETASNEVATLTLNNTGNSSVDITSARLNFYLETNNQEAELAELARSGTISANLTVGGPFVDLDPQITLPASSTTDITVSFYRDTSKTQTKNIQSGEFFVLTMVYSTGETDTYFVAP